MAWNENIEEFRKTARENGYTDEVTDKDFEDMVKGKPYTLTNILSRLRNSKDGFAVAKDTKNLLGFWCGQKDIVERAKGKTLEESTLRSAIMLTMTGQVIDMLVTQSQVIHNGRKVDAEIDFTANPKTPGIKSARLKAPRDYTDKLKIADLLKVAINPEEVVGRPLYTPVVVAGLVSPNNWDGAPIFEGSSRVGSFPPCVAGKPAIQFGISDNPSVNVTFGPYHLAEPLIEVPDFQAVLTGPNALNELCMTFSRKPALIVGTISGSKTGKNGQTYVNLTGYGWIEITREQLETVIFRKPVGVTPQTTIDMGTAPAMAPITPSPQSAAPQQGQNTLAATKSVVSVTSANVLAVAKVMCRDGKNSTVDAIRDKTQAAIAGKRPDAIIDMAPFDDILGILVAKGDFIRNDNTISLPGAAAPALTENGEILLVMASIAKCDKGPNGAKYEDVLAASAPVTKQRVEDIIAAKIDEGDVYEPTLGWVKIVNDDDVNLNTKPAAPAAPCVADQIAAKILVPGVVKGCIGMFGDKGCTGPELLQALEKMAFNEGHAITLSKAGVSAVAEGLCKGGDVLYVNNVFTLAPPKSLVTPPTEVICPGCKKTVTRSPTDYKGEKYHKSCAEKAENADKKRAAVPAASVAPTTINVPAGTTLVVGNVTVPPKAKDYPHNIFGDADKVRASLFERGPMTIEQILSLVPGDKTVKIVTNMIQMGEVLHQGTQYILVAAPPASGMSTDVAQVKAMVQKAYSVLGTGLNKRSFVTFAKKDGMNIEGLTPEIIEPVIAAVIAANQSVPPLANVSEAIVFVLKQTPAGLTLDQIETKVHALLPENKEDVAHILDGMIKDGKAMENPLDNFKIVQ